MHTNTPWVDAAWFSLDRHDDPPPDPAPEPAPAADPPDPTPEPDPEPDPAPDTGKVKDWQAEAEKWKALSRKHEKDAKDGRTAKEKLAEIEDAQKTEGEKQTARAEKAEAKAAAAISRAVKAEIKALAADDFADPTDADGAITAAEFVDDNGEVDVAGIKAKLAEILDAKPHWRKTTEPLKVKAPKPDPGQGPRQTPASVNFKDADKADFHAELAKYGVKPKTSA